MSGLYSCILLYYNADCVKYPTIIMLFNGHVDEFYVVYAEVLPERKVER